MTIFETVVLLVLVFVNLSIAFLSVGVLFGASFGAPFVPSSRKSLGKMLELAQVKQGDTVFDLGCGDGRIVFAAAKMGAAKSIGIEISPLVYLIARIRKLFSGAKNSEIRFGNIFSQADYGEADVVFAFLMPNLMQKVFAEIWSQLPIGARLISSSFFSKEIAPDIVIPRTKGQNKIGVYVKKAGV